MIALSPGRLAASLGALLVCERPFEGSRQGQPESAHSRKLELLVAGCRFLTDRLLDVAGAYAGLATFAAIDCGLDPTPLETHIEEPESALPPGLDRLAAGLDALVLPPGVSSRLVATAAVPAVRVELAQACLVELVHLEQRSARGSVALLLPAGLVSRLLAATLAQHVPDAPLLTYVGLDHLRGQLGVLARLHPARVLAEPAAADLARRAGLPARSIYEGPGRCLLVHALERALARASLGRLPALAHGGSATMVAGAEIACLSARASGQARASLEPVRDVLALRTTRRFVLVPTASISYLSGGGGLVTAYADGGSFWTDRTLAEIEARLDPRHFLRLDASRLVNLARVAELIPWTHQRYRLVFADAAKTELMLSRDVGRRLRAALGW